VCGLAASISTSILQVLVDRKLRFSERDFNQAVFFDDLWETPPSSRSGRDPGHQVMRTRSGRARPRASENGAGRSQCGFRGGLAGWQQKKAHEFIEGHLHEDIALQSLRACGD